jgi:hypothetical protein
MLSLTLALGSPVRYVHPGYTPYTYFEATESGDFSRLKGHDRPSSLSDLFMHSITFDQTVELSLAVPCSLRSFETLHQDSDTRCNHGSSKRH